MRNLARVIKLFIFPLIGLGVSTFLMFTTFGVVENPLVKTKRTIASVQKNLDSLSSSLDAVNSMVSIDSSGSPREIDYLKGEKSIAAAITTDKAGLDSGQIHIVSGDSTRSQLNESCDFENLVRSVKSQQVKFNFSNCNPEAQSIRIRNRTNGYEAQIFSLRGRNVVSTDYVQLRLGENELVFEDSSSTGQNIVRTIKVIRDQ